MGATMTATEAAAALGISADTLRRRIRRGALPAHRDPAGRLLVTLTEDLQADAGALQAMQAEVQALQSVLGEVRGERDRLGVELERVHERLREAHVLLAQRPLLEASRDADLVAESAAKSSPRWWRRWFVWP